MIRRARPGDIPDLVRMAGDFIAVSETGLPFDADYVAASLRAHLVAPGALVLVLDEGGPRGMLCAVAVRSPLAPVALAQELAFWIDPDHRGRAAAEMMRAYCAWARETGCARAAMVALPGPPALDRLYARAGFARAETVFSQDL